MMKPGWYLVRMADGSGLTPCYAYQFDGELAVAATIVIGADGRAHKTVFGCQAKDLIWLGAGESDDLRRMAEMDELLRSCDWDKEQKR